MSNLNNKPPLEKGSDSKVTNEGVVERSSMFDTIKQYFNGTLQATENIPATEDIPATNGQSLNGDEASAAAVAKALQGAPDYNDDGSIDDAKKADEEGKPKELTLEDIEKLEAAAAGEAADGGFSVPATIRQGEKGIVTSLERDLGLNPFPPTEQKVWETPVQPQSIQVNNPVQILDLTPKLEGGDAIVDEDDLLANRGPNESEGSDPVKESTTVQGDFKILAPDGVKDLTVGGFFVITNGAFAPVAFMTPLGNILAMTSYNPATGVITYEYTLLDNEQHPNANGENSIFEDFIVKLSDINGDTAEGILSVNIVDDVPKMELTEGVASLIVDETFLAVDATASFANLFHPVPGADGATIVYNLSITEGANSGLVDTATGSPVLLFKDGADIVGLVGNAEVFRISIDPNTGDVTLNQSRAVVHDDPTDPDEANSPAMLSSDDLIKITATITDGDGDVASATQNIGDAFKFKDDGPSIQVSLADKAPDELIVDETNLNVNASADFSDNFTANPNFGADGAGTLSSSYTLLIPQAGTDSGLIDVATQESVLLYLNGGVVEGRTSGTNVLVFTVSVDGAGIVTLDQIRAIDHPDPNNPDDAVTLAESDLIQLKREDTIVDKDGDSAKDDSILNIGTALFFKDDGPHIDIGLSGQAPDLLQVDETILAINATANFADNFTINSSSFGADGPGSITNNYVLSIAAPGIFSGLFDVATGQPVLLFMNGNVVEGRTSGSNDLVFTLGVDNVGNVTLDQIRALQHPNPVNPGDAVTLSDPTLIKLTLVATIVDKDGDSAQDSQSLNIGQALSFKDDGPSIIVNIVAPPDALVVDETNLATNASANFADNFSNTPLFGADGAGTITSIYALSVSAPNAVSGLIDVATGQAVLLSLNGGVVEGRTAISNDLVFTVSVNGAGTVTLDQIRALQHPNPSNPDDTVTLMSADLIKITRTDVIVDKDGDSAQNAATLNIGTALSFKDDGPSIHVSLADVAPDLLVVDETNLNLNASANFADNFNNTFSYGADGAGTVTTNYALSVSAPNAVSGLIDVATGQAVLLSLNGGVVEGRTAISGALVFTVSVNAAGLVTLDQIRALQHPNPANPDDAVTLASADLVKIIRIDTIVDKDGDSAQSAASINIGTALSFKDDGPSISVNVVAPPDALVVDETNLALNASANFADNFNNTFSYGADGAGTVTSNYALSVSAPNAVSGLFDVATGQAVLLSLNGGVVEGRTAISNALVFTVSVDAAGVVTLDQIRALQHPNPANPDDAVTLLSADLIKITRTDVIVDKDGDSVQSAASINIGTALSFKDDGPSISVNIVAAADALVVDETNLAVNASANFADNFSSTPVFGADGAGTVTSNYALSISAPNAVSGLIDVATGQAVLLSLNGGVVEGRTAISNVVVFTVSVDAAGVVTLDQIRALQHPNPANPDDAVTLASADLIKITRTDIIVDKDGDSAQSAATLNIGTALSFEDDGPSIQVSLATVPPDALVVDETNLALNASANFADNFVVNSNYGADGAGTITTNYALSVSAPNAVSGLIDVATGQAVLLSLNGGVVEGRTAISGALVFTVSVDAAGIVTLDQIRALQHPNPANPDDAVTLAGADLIKITRTDVIVDKDGDSAQSAATLNIGTALSFEDDGPSIVVNAIAAADALVVDETNLATNASANFADNFSNTPVYGADGAGTVTSNYALSVSAPNAVSGLIDVATGQAVLLSLNGGVVEGRTAISNALVFTVSVDAAGIVTLDQIRALQHPNPANPDDAVTLTSADLIKITRTDVIVDKDGDSAQSAASINIGTALSFKDDGPSISVNITAPADALVVDETNLNINASANFADNFSNTPLFGADGAGTFTGIYALSVNAAGANSGLLDVATGQAVLLFLNGGVVEGRTAISNVLVFTVSVDAAGVVTLDQIRALQHPNPANPDDAVTLSDANLIKLSLTGTIVDKDGDSAQGTVTLNIGTALSFKDDGPSIQVSLATVPPDALVVDETNLATNASANFADNFVVNSNYGADGAGTVTTNYALSVSAPNAVSGLIDVATGQSVLLSLNGGVVEGRTSGSNVLVFTVSVDAAGVVTLDQIRALQHPNPANPDDAVTLASADLIKITRTDVIVDKDGDSAQSAASINIGTALSFKDDGPSISVNIVAAADALVVDETVLATNATANYADNFSNTFAYGADGEGTVTTTYALSVSAPNAVSGLIDVATGQTVLLSLNGGVVEGRTSGSNVLVFTVSVDAAGIVTLDQIRALQHPNTANPDDAVTLASADLIKITRTDVIVDKDGDSAQSAASINIGTALSFKDDGPSISVNAIAAADALVVDETNLATNATANFADNFSNTPVYGADGAGTVTSNYALSVSAPNAVSGLIDVATGQSVLLIMNGGVVEGRTSGSNVLVFTVSVDAAGVVTLDQIRALQHPNTANPDDAVTLASADLIKITRTDVIVDKDGDSAQSAASINIGTALSFKDDGPSISVNAIAAADALVVDETNLATNASANFADNFSNTPVYGADGAGTVTSNYALSVSAPNAVSGLIDVATGQAVLLSLNGGVVEGRTAISGDLVFMVSVNAAGTVTLDQIRALQHPNTANPDDAVTLASADLIKITRTDVIVDKDGDSAQSAASINIGTALSFKDDGPSIAVNAIAAADALVVDETVLATNATANYADNFSTTFAYGADGAGTVTTTYALSVSAPNAVSGLIDVATGQTVLLSLNGGVVEGRTSGSNALVFTVSVNAAGTVTLDQIRALQHPITVNPDDAVTLASADLIKITRTDVIVDKDGDSAQSAASINIGTALSFEDDGPSIVVNILAAADALMVDETNLATNATANFSDNFSNTFAYGADGAGTVTSNYSLAVSLSGISSGLIDVATGQTVFLFMNGGTVEGRIAGGIVVFTVSVSAAGIVTLDQIRALQHPNASNPDDAVTLASTDLIKVVRTDTIVDRDGDTALSSNSINIGQALSFKDDGPRYLNVNDPDLDTIVEVSAFNPAANITHNVQLADWAYGADGAGILPTLTGTTGSIVYNAVSSTQVQLTFYEGSNVVAVLTLNANGTDSLQLMNRPTLIIEDELLTSEAKAGGPGVYFVDSSIQPNLTVRVTGDDNDGISELSSDDQANPSAQGWAVSNNIIEVNESIKFATIDKTTSAPISIFNFSFAATGFTGGQSSYDIQVKVTYSNNTTETFSLNVTEGQVISVKDINGFNVGSFINSVEVFNVDNTPGGNVGFRLNSVKISAQSTLPPADLDYNFTLNVTDKDGDSVSQQFTLHIDGDPAPALPGYTVDGPIVSATIFQDLNLNAVADSGEAIAISGNDGAYHLMATDTNLDGSFDAMDGRIVSIGGVDSETGLSYDIPLFAPVGSSIISPLTSILEMQLEKKVPIDNLMAKINQALGIAPSSDLTQINPLQANNGSNIALIQAAAIMTLSIQMTDALSHILHVPAAEVADDVYLAIGNTLLNMPSDATADFSDPAFISSVIAEVNNLLGLDHSQLAPIADVLEMSQNALQASLVGVQSDPVDAISAVQTITQGVITDMISSFYNGEISEATLNKSSHDLLVANTDPDAGAITVQNAENYSVTSYDSIQATDEKVTQISLHTDNAKEYIAENGLDKLHAQADEDGKTVHIPVPQDGSEIEFTTPMGGSLALNSSGEYAYSVNANSQDQVEHFSYTLLNSTTGNLHQAQLDVNVFEHPASLVNLMGSDANDIMSTANHNANAIMMEGGKGINDFIIDVGDANAPETIFIKDLGMNKQNILSFVGVQDGNHDGKVDFMDAVASFHQDGPDAHLEVTLQNKTTVIFENVGTVPGNDIQALQQHLESITADLHVTK